MTIQTEIEYEDLTGLWADLESGLGMILNNPRARAVLSGWCGTTAGCKACCSATRTWVCTCCSNWPATRWKATAPTCPGVRRVVPSDGAGNGAYQHGTR